MTGALLDVPDVVILVGKSRQTVWTWTRRGVIPPAAVAMFGRVARYRPDALVAAGLVDGQRVAALVAEAARA